MRILFKYAEISTDKKGFIMKLNEVAKFFGGKKKLADALGIYPSAVTQWGETVPLSRQYQIEVMTKGRFKAVRKAA